MHYVNDFSSLIFDIVHCESILPPSAWTIPNVVYSYNIFNCIVTGSTDDSKANTDQGPDVDEEQSKPNEADDAEEGNLEDEEGDDEEGTGQQEQQGTQDNEDTGELDLPDDLQLDEEGDEGNNGTLYQFRFCCVVVAFASKSGKFLEVSKLRQTSTNLVFFFVVCLTNKILL